MIPTNPDFANLAQCRPHIYGHHIPRPHIHEPHIYSAAGPKHRSEAGGPKPRSEVSLLLACTSKTTHKRAGPKLFNPISNPKTS